MNDTHTKTTEEWAKDLGFEELRIRVESSMRLHMQFVRSEPYCSDEFVRPYRFTLRGFAKGSKYDEYDDSKWDKLAHFSTVRFCVQQARAQGVKVKDIGRSIGVPVRREAVDAGLAETVRDSLLFEDLWIDPKYRDRGLEKHLFDRALEFHDIRTLGCITAPSGETYFHGTTDGGMILAKAVDAWVSPWTKRSPERPNKVPGIWAVRSNWI